MAPGREGDAPQALSGFCGCHLPWHPSRQHWVYAGLVFLLSHCVLASSLLGELLMRLSFES